MSLDDIKFEFPERKYERKFYDKDSLDSIKDSGALDTMIKFIDNKEASDTAIELLKSVNYKMMSRACRYLHIDWKMGDGHGNTWYKAPDKTDFQHVLCQGMIEIWKSYQNMKLDSNYDKEDTNTFNASLNNLDLQLVMNEASSYYQWNVKFNIEDITKFYSGIQPVYPYKEKVVS